MITSPSAIVFNKFLKSLFFFYIIITFFVVSTIFAQEKQEKDETAPQAAVQREQPLLAYWLKNLYFVRGITYNSELWNNEGNGAFRSRWRFTFSNPLWKHYSIAVEAPVVLVVPIQGKSVAGLGDVNVLFQAAFREANITRQFLGLRVFFPTGSHPQTGGDLMTLNPRYQIDFINNKYIIPSFPIEYYFSVIQGDDAEKLRVLALKPLLAVKQIGPKKIGFSGSVQFEWDFNFISDRSGGLLYCSIAKQLNPNTLFGFEFSPALSDYTKDILWNWRYTVSILMTF
jgi:hypothetical protein